MRDLFWYLCLGLSYSYFITMQISNTNSPISLPPLASLCPNVMGGDQGCASVVSPSRYIPNHKRPPPSSCPNDDGPGGARSSPGATGGRVRLPPHSPPPSCPSSPSSLPRPRAALHPPSVIGGGGYYLYFTRAGVRNVSR